MNPLDVEEIVWDIASLSRLDPSSVPPPSMMSLPRGKADRRKIMVRCPALCGVFTVFTVVVFLLNLYLRRLLLQGTVYSLFRGSASELDLVMAGRDGK